MQTINLKPTPIGKHRLPKLSYRYNELEPIIDEQTLTLHHSKHHKKYVDDLNNAEILAKQARETNNFDNIGLIEQNLAFNGAGHILHCIYWTIMTTPGRDVPISSVTDSLITSYFGSIENFKNQFISAALKVYGSGWCILGYNPYFKHLEILQVEKHEVMTQWAVIPVLVCDVWEHAYYLKYQNNRIDYINAWYSLINWYEVEQRLIYAIQTRGILENPIETLK